MKQSDVHFIAVVSGQYEARLNAGQLATGGLILLWALYGASLIGLAYSAYIGQQFPAAMRTTFWSNFAFWIYFYGMLFVINLMNTIRAIRKDRAMMLQKGPQ